MFVDDKTMNETRNAVSTHRFTVLNLSYTRNPISSDQHTPFTASKVTSESAMVDKCLVVIERPSTNDGGLRKNSRSSSEGSSLRIWITVLPYINGYSRIRNDSGNCRCQFHSMNYSTNEC